MRLFISWSGDTSRAIAEQLRSWLPEVVQRVEPWMSSEDIDAGDRWSLKIARELETCSEGVIIVTAANHERPWLNFEAGALAKTMTESRVRPLLWKVEPKDITGPLAQFQMLRLADREDVLKLVGSLNEGCSEPLSSERLVRAFDRAWGDLQAGLENISDYSEGEPPQASRSQSEMVAEVLDVVRSIQRSIPALLERQESYLSGRQRDTYVGDMGLVTGTGTGTFIPLRQGLEAARGFDTELADDPSVFEPGDQVQHPRYGLGSVVEVRDGYPVVNWDDPKHGKRMHIKNSYSLLKNLGYDPPF